jgi:hypothetical protein
MLLNNESILKIKYTLREENNKMLLAELAKIEHLSSDKQRKKILSKHKIHLPLWQKIVFPIWLWKSLMHDKHEAFAFKYDTRILLRVENEIMESIGTILYVNAACYYFIAFFCPFYFADQCGEGLHMQTHLIYFTFALASIIIECMIVFWIQTVVHNKSLLRLNKWHCIELFLGTIGKLDTYLDLCILSMFLSCKEWHFVGPISFFIFLALIYPIFRLFRSRVMATEKTLSHTLPYMERNCQICFVRENMLLATVLDSFCIDNNETIKNRPVHYGKLMGALTFFLQDFPQMSIHIIFLFMASRVPH